MAFNIGLNVVEVDGAGAPAIAGAATSVAGFNITTRRGLANRPTRVTSFRQFTGLFGGFAAASYGAYMVKGFFDNGGQTAYINRVVSTDANPASGSAAAVKMLQDLGGANTLEVFAGQRGAKDPGSWGEGIYVKAEPASTTTQRLRETGPATLTGTALAATVDMTALPALSVLVDGEAQPVQISFSPGDFNAVAAATPEEIRNVINRQTKLQASVTADRRLVLRSTGQVARQNRRFTRIEVAPANATLGLSAAAADAEVAAFAATGTTLGSAESFNAGDAIEISDGTRTHRAKVLRTNAATGAVEWVPAAANPNDYVRLLTTVKSLDFKLTVSVDGTDAANVVEEWPGLSMESDAPNYAVRVLNNEISGSNYVTVVDSRSASGVGQNRPNQTAFTPLQGGRDGVPTVNDYIGDSSKATGFSAFDPADIQLLTCERADPAITAAALGYCQNRGDCMYVGSVPFGFVGARQAIPYGQTFQGKKVYGALYGPWIKVTDPASSSANPVRFVPPSGHAMGVYARVETARGIWKAPAGDEAVVVGAIDVEYQLSDTDHTALVKEGSVNGVRAIPGAGIVLDASRTLSTDTRWLYVNVRLLFNYVKSSLKKGLRWVRQEPNRDTLWNTVKYSAVVPFLMGLHRQGAFGTGKPEQVFSVICDATNNPPDQVDLGVFKLEVYFYPSKPAETIVILVGQQPSGASAAEA